LKRRVLFWAQAFWPHIDGVTVLGPPLMLALRECGYEFQAVTSHGDRDLPDETTYQDIPVHRLPLVQALRRRHVALFRQARDGVARIKREFKPDVFT
jgi:hypothetical protein